MIECRLFAEIDLRSANSDLKDGQENTREETPWCEGPRKTTKSSSGQNQDEGTTERYVLSYVMTPLPTRSMHGLPKKITKMCPNL